MAAGKLQGAGEASVMRRIKAVLLVVAGVALTWLVLTKSLVAYLASVAPELALRIDPGWPSAVVVEAENELTAQAATRSAGASGQHRVAGTGSEATPPASRLAFAPRGGPAMSQSQSGAVAGGAGTSSGRVVASAKSDELRARLERALVREPLEVRALRILGQLADDAGDSARALAAMRLAARQSIRESTATYWLMLQDVQRQDHASALAHADALLRTRPNLGTLVLPALVALAESRAAGALVQAELARNPPWRGSFLTNLPALARDVRTPLEILLALKQAQAPPTVHEYRHYLDFLIARKHYELAFYTWLQLMPPDNLASTGFLFNGDFQLQPSGLPFDWVLRDGPGVSVEVAQIPGEQGQYALLVDFGVGRVEFPGVTQLTMLGPGSYRLKGRHRGEITGPRGLRWRVACVTGGRGPIGEGAMILGNVANWRELEVAFTVPAQDCRAQTVRLELDARSASEQIVTGRMWFDDMSIGRPVPAPSR